MTAAGGAPRSPASPSSRCADLGAQVRARRRGPEALVESAPLAYFEAVYYWARRMEGRAIQAHAAFEAAAVAAPDFAPAWAGLAGVLVMLPYQAGMLPREAFPRARAAAERARDLAPDAAEPLVPLAHVAWRYEWDARRGRASAPPRPRARAAPRRRPAHARHAARADRPRRRRPRRARPPCPRHARRRDGRRLRSLLRPPPGHGRAVSPRPPCPRPRRRDGPALSRQGARRDGAHGRRPGRGRGGRPRRGPAPGRPRRPRAPLRRRGPRGRGARLPRLGRAGRDVGFGFGFPAWLAPAHAVLGETDAALAALERAVDVPRSNADPPRSRRRTSIRCAPSRGSGPSRSTSAPDRAARRSSAAR